MRWTTYAIAIPLGLFVLAANIDPAAAQGRPDNNGKGPQAAKRVHEERDAVTNTLFSSTTDDQGNAVVTVRVGDLMLEKVVASSGDSTLRLSMEKDVVSIAMNHGGYVVARGRKTARFDAQNGTQEDMDAIRGVLLGSQAVRAFRRLSSSLENRDEGDEEGPLFLSTLVDGAIVQLLDGDEGAPQRIGKRITRKRRASLQQAKLLPDRGEFVDCVLNYEMALINAWDLLYQCTETTFTLRWWMWWGAETLCEFEWLMRSQQYIYQFISCFAWPF